VRRSALSLAVVFCLVAGCSTGTPLLEDSLGTRVGWLCEGHDCQVNGVSVEPPDCDGDDIFVVGAGAIAVLCASSVAMDHTLTLHEATCRPLLCATETDCPQWPDRRYGCDSGFCTTADLALDMLDIEAVCLRTAARGATCADIDADPSVQMAMSMASAACASGPCTIPAACRP
jgi:hypothetical protein